MLLILLEKKLKNAIDAVNSMMRTEGIPATDQTRDVMRSIIKGGTSFENTFDNIIEAGKKENNDQFPKSGKKNEVESLQSDLNNAFA